MIEIFRWHKLERWDAFTVPHLHIGPHLPQKRIGDLLVPRIEKVDRKCWSFEQLQPITIHFGGEISRRKISNGTSYSLDLFWVKPGDVVLSKIDLKNGAMGVLPDNWQNVVVTSHFRVYSPDLKQIDPRYLKLLLRTADFKRWLWANRSGADGRTEVKLAVFEALEIPLPPKTQQSALCDSYESALYKAGQSEKEADKIDQTAWQAFASALGVAPPPLLPERPVFIAQFKDIERWSHSGVLGDITPPESNSGPWPLIPLGKAGKVSYGIQKCPANRPSTHARPYLRVANVQRGFLDLDEIKYINVPDEEMSKLRLENGDVLLCEGNSPDLVGRGAIWRDEIKDCVHQNHVLRVRVDQSQLLPEFVLSIINSSHGQAYFRSKAKRTTNLASINSKEVAGLPMPVPPIPEQAELLKALNRSLECARMKRSEARQLRSAAWEAFESALFEAPELAMSAIAALNVANV